MGFHVSLPWKTMKATFWSKKQLHYISQNHNGTLEQKVEKDAPLAKVEDYPLSPSPTLEDPGSPGKYSSGVLAKKVFLESGGYQPCKMPRTVT